MKSFKKSLNAKIIQSLSNNYGVENYDEYRYGKLPKAANEAKLSKLKPIFPVGSLKRIVKKLIGYKYKKNHYLTQALNLINPLEKEFENLWNNLSKHDRELVVNLIAYRVLGYKKVKLKRNNATYWEAIEKAKSMANNKDTLDPHFLHFVLKKMDLNPIGLDIKFYYTEKGTATNFIIEQYAYKVNKLTLVEAENEDIVLDIGACWGDTALYFANKVGENGKVYSFEFIPDNIKLFNTNMSLNPSLYSRIELIKKPVSNISGDIIYFKDYGPGSKVEFKPFEEQTGTSATISIDDFVTSKGIHKIDLIKMDIEGAEPLALQGALETIKKFKPKLAIAIYHSLDDFATIPNWILNLDLGYEIFIDHYTIHAEETICFAKLKN